MSGPGFSLEGRVAVVTGAASGIGRATAWTLAGAGAKVALADLDLAGLEETRGPLSSDVVHTGALDVSKADDVEAFFDGAEEALGPIDVVANVAGVLAYAPLVELEAEALDRVLAVNLKGVLFGCQSAVRRMRPRKRGAIVNVASSAAFTAYPSLGAYSMSKAAVVKLTQVLAMEVADAGIRVNAVAPGAIDTPMAGQRFREPDGSMTAENRERMLEFVRQSNPLGVEGWPEDVAYAIQYLASDAARYITGQVIHPNGGTPLV
ncbi:MAG: SDR family NAD(P)-dependent oxidoreductase [Myxococcota bacterium]|nr:SDR family NAD(P)-dependent oxidoreductase [Myxococcota bacterium]